MKDYQEALDRLENFAYHGGEKGNNVKIIQELVNEKLEQESRKDKLIAGSQWECVANCMIDKGAHSSEYVKNGDIVEIHYCDPELFVFIDEHRFLMIPTQQFLLCFKPIKEVD